MIYDGIESLCVDDATGELVIQTEWGEMRDAKPVAYQEIEGVRKKVDISFCLPVPARQTGLMGEKRVVFALGDYDPNFMLTLDPGYSTYIGGRDDDLSYGTLWIILVLNKRYLWSQDDSYNESRGIV